MAPMRFVVFCVLVSSLVISPTATAETVFVAQLDGLQNVPPIETVTSWGSATLILSDDQTQLSYHIEYWNLSSEELWAHIHNAPKRKTGPDVLSLPLGTRKIGTWQIPPELVLELFADRLYINIHTALYPVRGEMRGNIAREFVPVEKTTWGRIKAMYAGY